MLKIPFDFALNEFGGLQAQVYFFASLEFVSSAFNDGYLKWTINGLGEAFGFWFKLKSTQQPFIVKTLVNIEGIDPSEPIEWTIDAKDLETAMEVFSGLELDTNLIKWKKDQDSGT